MRSVFAGVAAVVLTLTTVPVADAETGVPLAARVADLPLAGVTDAVLDAGHDQLFVSSQSEGRVAVADLTTGHVTRLPYLADAGAMDLDDSGAYLWVSLRSEGAVARVSTVAPFESTIFPLGRRCPRDLVATAGTVYVVADDDCLRQWDELVMLDPGTGTVTESTAEPGAHATIYNPVLRQIPGTSRIHWQSYGITGSPSGIIDAATDSLIATTQNSSVLAVMPDGENVLTHGGDLLSTTDLSLTGHLSIPPIPDHYSYEWDHDPAISADGLLAYPDVEQLAVYDLNSGTPVGRWQLDPVEGLGIKRAFWDESTLYGLGAVGPMRLAKVADVRAPSTSQLTVADPDRAVYVPRGSQVTVSGRLVDGSGEPIADAPINIHAGDSTDLLASPVTAPDGSWSAVVTLDWYSLRVHFPGDDLHAAAAATVDYSIGTQHFLTVEGPAEAAPSDTLAYQGRVVDQQGRPVPDVDVNVSWECGSRAFDGSVVTGGDGMFRYDTEAPRCEHLVAYFYVDGPEGSMGNPGNATVETDIDWRVSTLTAQGPERLAPGESGTWTATLKVDGSPEPGAVVLFRSTQGSSWETGSLTTDAQGVVTLTTDAVHEHSGGVTFRYAGDPVTLGSVDRVDTLVAPWPSSLTVTPSNQTPTAGDPLTFAGQLGLGNGESPEGRMVQVTQDDWRPLPTATVAADGSFTVTLRPSTGPYTWSFRFAGDARHAAVTTSVSLWVSARTATLTTTRVAESSPTSQVFRATAEPGYADMCLHFRVDRRTPNGWRKVSTSGCRLTGEAGVARYRTSRDLPTAGRYRMRPTFAGDAFTAPAKGTWRRFRLG
ncbi:MAG: hypothetical protein ACRDOX_04305 [Nocardioides sp.]